MEKHSIPESSPLDSKEGLGYLANRRKEMGKVFNSFVSIKSLIPSIDDNDLTLRPEGLPVDEEKWSFDDFIDRAKETKRVSNDLNTPFADGMFRELMESPEILEKIKEVFRGQVVVDIAAGDNEFGYKIACLSGAMAYVAVEPYRDYDLIYTIAGYLNPELIKNEWSLKRRSMAERVAERDRLGKIPVAIVQEDMLTFLKRLPPEAVSVWCSGIDQCVIPDRHYIRDVEKQVARVIHPNGGYVTDGGAIYLHESNIESERIDSKGKTFFIYKKVGKKS